MQGADTLSSKEDHAATFAKMTGELLTRPDESHTAQSIVEIAAQVVHSAEHVSLTVAGRRGTHTTLGSTSTLAARCDAMQYELQEGPCLAALHEQDYCRSGDLAQDPRWPRWGAYAAGMGIASLLSIRLSLGTKPVGAINMYSSRFGGFDDDDELHIASLYSLHAATALAAAQEIAGLQTAMQSRHTIGVAQGVLMARFNLTVERSFEVLRRYSSTHNLKLVDVAGYVVEHHQLPPLS
jgi:GAF domain-containing protein